MSGNWRMGIHFWREMAEVDGCVSNGDDSPETLCKPHFADGVISNYSTAHCQYRYPSPRRSDRFAVRPTPSSYCNEVARGAVKSRSCVREWQIYVVSRGKTSDSGGHKTKQTKGSLTCINSVSFSQPPLSHRFQLVWTQTSSVASRALQRVQSSLTPRVAMSSPARSWAALLARFATNLPAFAANPAYLTGAFAGASIIHDRRAGFPLRGGFSFAVQDLEGRPCSRKF